MIQKYYSYQPLLSRLDKNDLIGSYLYTFNKVGKSSFVISNEEKVYIEMALIYKMEMIDAGLPFECPSATNPFLKQRWREVFEPKKDMWKLSQGNWDSIKQDDFKRVFHNNFNDFKSFFNDLSSLVLMAQIHNDVQKKELPTNPVENCAPSNSGFYYVFMEPAISPNDSF